jgi:hypothetical protein
LPTGNGDIALNVKSLKPAISVIETRIFYFICNRHKAVKPRGIGRYVSGQKRCQICQIFIKWDGFWCPCCGYRLRTRPRNLRFRIKFRNEILKIKQEALLIH